MSVVYIDSWLCFVGLVSGFVSHFPIPLSWALVCILPSTYEGDEIEGTKKVEVVQSERKPKAKGLVHGMKSGANFLLTCL